jgi:crotonobetaine/carnitine-CoA ligase
VKICVVVKPDATVTHEDLLRHCLDRMPHFAVPRYIEIVDDLPRNAVGRVLKYVLRERGVTDATWDREQTPLASRPRRGTEG